MPLSKRQKRRLLEVSKMIESSIVVRDDMEEIQLEYASEIDEVIEMIKNKDVKPKLIGEASTEMAPYEEKARSDSKKTQGSTNEHQSEPNLEPPEIPEGPDAPEWAKKLWKGIAKKCHPDRLSFQELTAIQIARRQTWFLEARSLYENRSWNKLLHIGVQVEEYVEDLSASQQLAMLNEEYAGITQKVEDIQKSLAWKWGTNWDNLEMRLRIMDVCLRAKGVTPPSRIEMINILVNLEVD